MDSTLQYRQVVASQPPCEDSWFREALARCRAGDEGARRRILGSCLRVALAVVERQGDDDLLERVQDANAVLEAALTNFQGDSAAAFLAHADRAVTDSLQPT